MQIIYWHCCQFLYHLLRTIFNNHGGTFGPIVTARIVTISESERGTSLGLIVSNTGNEPPKIFS